MISFLLVFFIVGCSNKNTYSKTSRYFDQNLTKDQILHAAKRVFHLSDKNAFVIDSYRNDLNITKTKAAYKLYTMEIQNDHFEFSVDKNSSKEKIQASISIYRTYGLNDENIDYLDEKSIEYTMFWNRVSYLLNIKKEWHGCRIDNNKYDFEYMYDGFLCDIIDLEDTEASQKDILDLNVTHNISRDIETIQIETSYSIPEKKNNKNHIYGIDHQYSIDKNNDINGTTDNYNIKKYDNLDNNNSKDFKINLELENAKNKNNDINSTKE